MCDFQPTGALPMLQLKCATIFSHRSLESRGHGPGKDHVHGMDGKPTEPCSWSTLRRWPWRFKVFLLLSAITSGHLRSVGWGGVGMMTFLELAHMVGATQHHVSCTGTHGRCYATSCFLHLHTWSVLRNIMFLALAHMVGATQHHVSCTCTHGRRYATSCFLHLHTWSALRNIMFLALAHMVGATQHHVSCTCTHGRCYATSCFLHLQI